MSLSTHPKILQTHTENEIERETDREEKAIILHSEKGNTFNKKQIKDMVKHTFIYFNSLTT